MDSPEQVTSEIQQRIKGLLPLSGDELKNEMEAVKGCLLANPAACSLLMDEDIGSLVAALRKITGAAIQAAVDKPKKGKKPKTKQLTAEEMAEALDDM